MYRWTEWGGCQRHKTWAVLDPDGNLVCVCVYKKGAIAAAEQFNCLYNAVNSLPKGD